jgi:osmotically inducible protein OsmC
MILRKASAMWEGTLKEGKGTMRTGSGAFEGPYSFATRFGDDRGTNPDELIAAAHAGCFSMELAARLTQAGHPPTGIRTEAELGIEPVRGGYSIKHVRLLTHGIVPGIDEAEFRKHAEGARDNCPVSKALAGVEITLEARLAKKGAASLGT